MINFTKLAKQQKKRMTDRLKNRTVKQIQYKKLPEAMTLAIKKLE